MRKYKRRSERGQTLKIEMLHAVKEVVENQKTIRQAGKEFGIPHVTLTRYVKKYRMDSDVGHVGYKQSRLVFTAGEEKELAEYAIRAAKLFFGLTPLELRRVAYRRKARP